MKQIHIYSSIVMLNNIYILAFICNFNLANFNFDCHFSHFSCD